MAHAWEMQPDRPAARLEVVDRHIRSENAHAIAAHEVMVSGTQEGSWRRLPPTGRRVNSPLAAAAHRLTIVGAQLRRWLARAA